MSAPGGRPRRHVPEHGPTPRIPPLPPGEWTNAARDVFAVMDGQEAWENGSKFNIVNTLAHHPKIAIPFLQLNRVLLLELTLPMRLREIGVLRVAHLSHCEYEWVQHVKIGTRIGLTGRDFDAIKAGAPAEDWSELDALVLQAATQLCRRDSISDALWARLIAHFDRREILEFLFVLGAYKMSAWIFNAVRVNVED